MPNRQPHPRRHHRGQARTTRHRKANNIHQHLRLLHSPPRPRLSIRQRHHPASFHIRWPLLPGRQSCSPSPRPLTLPLPGPHLGLCVPTRLNARERRRRRARGCSTAVRMQQLQSAQAGREQRPLRGGQPDGNSGGGGRTECGGEQWLGAGGGREGGGAGAGGGAGPGACGVATGPFADMQVCAGQQQQQQQQRQGRRGSSRRRGHRRGAWSRRGGDGGGEEMAEGVRAKAGAGVAGLPPLGSVAV